MSIEPELDPPQLTPTDRQIRGSSVLFVGRLLALGLSLATQVLLVRLLSRSDFGAFAYALAIVSMARMVVGLGHQQALSRFLALYEEGRAYAKLLGTLVMEGTVILGAGLCLTLGVLGLQGWLTGRLVDDPQALGLLAIVIVLAPLEALDGVFESAFAVFSRARSIFVRKYLLKPGLRLAAVAALLVAGREVEVLAVGYVLGGALGTALYFMLLIRMLRDRGILRHFRIRGLILPFREVFAFSIPLLTTELVFISMNTVSVMLLGYFMDTEAVAAYRAVFPAARLNQLVMFTFAVLFTPLAARLFARGDREAMRDAYWRTATWLAVFSFPVFALTVPLAEPTTIILFGRAYADSAPILALLSFGYYANAALGFNALTLQVYGRLREVVSINVGAAVLNVVLSVALVPRAGPVGVAMANCITLLTQNALFQWRLGRGIGVPIFDLHYVRAYGVIAAAAGGLAAIQLLGHPPVAVSLGLAALTSALVVLANRDVLRIGQTFPELRRVPVAGRLLG